MPKKIDPRVKSRAVRLVLEHQQEYPSFTAAAGAVATQLGLGRETVRRWVVQHQVDSGEREGVASEDQAEVKRLKAENRRLRVEDSPRGNAASGAAPRDNRCSAHGHSQ